MAEYTIDKIAYGGDVYKLQDNQSGYITTETDPVFSASPAAGISATDISNWNAKPSTDEKVAQIPITSSFNAEKSLVLGNTLATLGGNTTTNSVITSPYLTYKYPSNHLYIKQSNGKSLAIYPLGLEWYNGTNKSYLTASSVTSGCSWSLPDKTGTIALTSDVPSISLNGSSTTSASFYAPTTAGTSGYMLVSNGSGAPTWEQAIPATSTYNGNTLTISNQNGLFSVKSVGSSNLNVGFSVDENGVGIFRYKASLASTDAVLGYDFTQQKTIVTELRTPTNNTDAATKKYVDDAVAAGGDIFVATVGTTTYADVLAAYNAGKTIIAEEDSNSTYYYYYFERYESANNIFYFGTPGHVSNNGTTKSLYMYTLDSSNTWSDSHIYLNIPIISLNGISNVPAASFYAPTTAGTSGQVLTSNGSGAPTWSAITVPTKTSDLTNDSGFITSSSLSDYVLKTSNLLGIAANISNDTGAINIYGINGNNVGVGIQVYGSGLSIYKIENSQTTSVFTYNAGTDQVSLTKLITPTNDSDAATKKYVDDSISTVPSISLNGSSTTSASFYAPTTAGTSGYMLVSNGSGAPTWAAITVPTKTSDLTNDSGFITSSTLPTSLSDLTNDMNVSDFPNDAGYSTQTIYASTTAPTSSDGSNGDIWLVYEISSES